jgi:predicted RNase H-like nuclease (RuvC/YqgF family)
MADTYTLKTYTEEELETLEDKDKEVNREWSEDLSEVLTIRHLDSKIASCDTEIAKATATKEVLQAKLDAIKAKIDE